LSVIANIIAIHWQQGDGPDVQAEGVTELHDRAGQCLIAAVVRRFPYEGLVDLHLVDRKIAQPAQGSGTSQAAAVVSGAAALLLQQRPTLTPGQVKWLLTSTAVPMKGVDAIARGAGQLNVKAVIAAATPTSRTPTRASN
jgi:subtilisin family serine protease